MRGRIRALTLVAILAATPVGPVGAQTPGGTYRSEAVHRHPHATAGAVVLRLPAGSANDPDGLGGTAWLLARALEDQVARALDPAEAEFKAEVQRMATVFTLLALPSAWERAWARVDSVLFEAPVDPALVEAHRRELLQSLAFEGGSPVAEFEREAAAILDEPGSPFARPPRGTAESLVALSPMSIEQYRRSFYRREAAVRSIVGPVPADTVPPPDPTFGPDSTLAPDSTLTPDSTLARDSALAPSASPAERAWVTGDRRVVVRDVTSTWMTVAYAPPADLPRTHLELVAFLLREDLDPTPPDPDRYGVSVRIEDSPRGTVLVVEATVFPEAADSWEARILGAVERLAAEPLGEDFFRWRRRRFRTHRLLEEGAPEEEAARMSADLLREDVVRDLGLSIWGLEADDLQEAARALGEPRIFRFGPDLPLDGSAGS